MKKNIPQVKIKLAEKKRRLQKSWVLLIFFSLCFSWGCSFHIHRHKPRKDMPGILHHPMRRPEVNKNRQVPE